MRLYSTDLFELPLPDKHRFPMAKYRLLRERVQAQAAEYGYQLLIPQAASDDQLTLAHHADYVRRATTGQLTSAEIRRIGFPWSLELIERSRRSVGATVEAARTALVEGAAVNLAGGTHHAQPDCGEGFCVFNDAAVAIRVLQQEGSIERAVVIDCDVHQGNGTAAIFEHDSSVFTFSMHGAKNFPLRKSPSDLDVPLPDGTGDDDYLGALDAALPQVLAAGPFDLAVYVSGADPFATDRYGRMSLTRDGLRERDRRVLTALAAQNIAVAVVMAGGYAPDISDIVEIHAATIACTQRYAWRGPASP
ncbi:histone deacetylase family protein [Lignipirellula cremea]|uniref:Histone deacetylase-like amidohydrolase n=1 Tax=Lignipirellula cremea TaxID=2528010 RepID=A0A518DSV9_9BACT|nr:histone deacetylase [Lignipirellula cremea]QDU94888.1 Histone deacetylase-like amidohydrolase [Lignipirellula cremea]